MVGSGATCSALVSTCYYDTRTQPVERAEPEADREA